MTTESATQTFNQRLWNWGTDDQKPRFLHVMIRVKDIDAAMHFYVDGLGMKPLGERFDVPVRKVSAIYLGFDSFEAGGCVELVKRWDAEGPYTHGTGYGHIAIGTPDLEGMIEKLEAMGTEVTLRPTVLLEGAPAVAFVKDPDGYSLELIQTRRS